MRYFVSFMITLGLLILVIFLLFHGGGKPKVTVTPKTLQSYASTTAEVSMTIDGAVNAASDHRQVRIIVNNNDVTFEEIHGYDGSVSNIKSFANTQNAYGVFLRALAVAGFTRGDTSKALSNETGYCPTGRRYIFGFNQDQKTLERFWASTCGNPKTYLGNLGLTVALFQAQVPDYQVLTSEINL